MVDMPESMEYTLPDAKLGHPSLWTALLAGEMGCGQSVSPGQIMLVPKKTGAEFSGTLHALQPVLQLILLKHGTFSHS